MNKTPRRENFGQGDIKMCILGVLYKQTEEIHATKILLLLPRTQSPNRLRAFLKELEEKGKITSFDRSNIHDGQITYKITQSGKDTVNKKFSAEYKEIEEMYGPKKNALAELKAFWTKIKGA